MKKIGLRLVAVTSSMLMISSALTSYGSAETLKSYPQYMGTYQEENVSLPEIMLYGKNAVVEKGDATVSSVYPSNHGETVATKQGSEILWNLSVEQSGWYAMEIRYLPIKGNDGTIEREMRLDGTLPFREAEFLTFPRFFADDIEDGTFAKDYHGNEIKPAQKEVLQWVKSEVKDPLGYFSGALKIYLEKGQHTLSLYASKEHMAIDYIRFYQEIEAVSYQQMLAMYQDKGYEKAEASLPVIQAEHPIMKSDPSIALLADRSSGYDMPQSAAVNLINTVGSDKWQTVGQSLTWEVNVPKAGLYRIGLRARQNILSGSVSGRKLLIDGEIPFSEASDLLFSYSGDFQKKYLGDNENGDYYFYFDQGRHEITMEVILTKTVASIVQRAEENLTKLNDIYRSILMITGSSPDLQRDYNFQKRIPEEIEMMALLADDFRDLIQELNAFAGENGESAATLNKICFQLDIMSKSPKDIAENMETFKTNIGSLGTWLLTAKQQPLEIDYILLAGENESEFSSKESGFQEFIFSIHSFIMSFFNDYEVVGGTKETGGESVTVWLVSGRDQAQILRQLIDNDFYKKTGIGVNLQLVPAGALLPSVLAGTGPDVSLSVAYTDPVNYAVRGAVTDLSQFDDFSEVEKRFHPSAMVPYRFNGSAYALPETQTFPMMFYRTDIFEELGITAPKTWDDFYRIIPILQKNNLEIGFQANLSGLQIFMYQQEIPLYLEDGAKVNLDSDGALDCFKQLTELYTKYNFAVSYDFANRFRTGEMPLAIQDYTLYNQLTVFAPEIKGMWEFVPIPGTADQNGNINNSVPSGGTAAIMLSKAASKENAWAFLKWWTQADIQSQYARQLEAVIGQAAKYATANVEAFQSLSWSTDIYDNIMAQWETAIGTPEVPGSYYTSRYVDFAFSKVYNNRENPVETMLDYVDEVNKELTRKRQEFGLTE